MDAVIVFCSLEAAFCTLGKMPIAEVSAYAHAKCISGLGANAYIDSLYIQILACIYIITDI